MRDPILATLEEFNEPVTRENYVNLAFLGEVPEEIDPEIESDFPEEFQTGFHELDKRLKHRAESD